MVNSFYALLKGTLVVLEPLINHLRVQPMLMSMTEPISQIPLELYLPVDTKTYEELLKSIQKESVI